MDSRPCRHVALCRTAAHSREGCRGMSRIRRMPRREEECLAGRGLWRKARPDGVQSSQVSVVSHCDHRALRPEPQRQIFHNLGPNTPGKGENEQQRRRQPCPAAADHIPQLFGAAAAVISGTVGVIMSSKVAAPRRQNSRARLPRRSPPLLHHHHHTSTTTITHTHLSHSRLLLATAASLPSGRVLYLT